MWKIEFYQTDSGECPTEDFIKGLSKAGEVQQLNRKINLLKMQGNQLVRPHADYLEDGIYELRIPVKHNQIRLLYFFFYKDAIIISHGIRKESRINPAEIRKAKANREDYFARHSRKK